MTIEYTDKAEVLSLETGSPVLLFTEEGEYYIGQKSDGATLQYPLNITALIVETRPLPIPLGTNWSGVPLNKVSDSDLKDVVYHFHSNELDAFERMVNYLLMFPTLSDDYRAQLLRILEL